MLNRFISVEYQLLKLSVYLHWIISITKQNMEPFDCVQIYDYDQLAMLVTTSLSSNKWLLELLVLSIITNI